MSTKSNNYYIVLTGAKKNVGDFLITQRALVLLENLAPEFRFIKYPRWQNFDDMDFVNNSQGIIILGGPGYQMNMYPGVYKLSEALDNIKVPICILGSGWFGRSGDKITEKLYIFNNTSRKLLSKINSSYAGLSCRDYQTLRVLNNNGFNNATMTGCPVWYDLESIDKEFVKPNDIRKIVFTPPQRELYSEQSMGMLKYLKEKFNTAEFIVSFHRGFGYVDEFTSESDAKNTQNIADLAQKLGMKTVDVAFDANKLKFYDDCDLHIGYRVHAHIYFLSKRLPSVLIHEDGRGNGVTEALNSPGINAYKVSTFFSRLFGVFNKNEFLAKAYGRIGLKLNMNIISELDSVLNNIQNSNYAIYQKTSKFIDDHYKVMEGFIKKMIYGKEAL